jgi:hypothetical protein
MPWDVVRRGNKWVVLSKSGRVLGTHSSKKAAREQQKALYASESREKKG